MSRVHILDGLYKFSGQDRSVAGYSFELVNGFNQGARGGFVTVDGSTAEGGDLRFPPRNIRIRVESEDSFEITGRAPSEAVVELAHETDEQIIERTRERFEILNEMTKAVKAGTVRAMIVSGPPGVGKSFGVENVLGKEDLFNALGNRQPKYEIVKGAMSAVGLYKKLYEFSRSNSVVVFDDCDSVLLDEVSLNLLKAALDTSKKRTISWNTDSRLLRQEDVPNSFEFRGGCIFITNISFANIRSKKLQDHLAALESRCHYVDLKMHTIRERLLRIRQIVADGMLNEYDFENGEESDIVDYISDNADKLREISLRTVLKTADLRKSFPDRWQQMASVTVMKN